MRKQLHHLSLLQCFSWLQPLLLFSPWPNRSATADWLSATTAYRAYLPAANCKIYVLASYTWCKGIPFSKLICPKLTQVGPKLVPSWVQADPSWAQVGSKLSSNWSQVGPKLGPSWPKLGPSWLQVKLKLVPSCSQVGSKLTQVGQVGSKLSSKLRT